jgi:RNA polymerase sigma-70 factor (ECF subfamily)
LEPESAFVMKAAAGSRAAFDHLVDQNRRRVYRLVRTLTAGDNDAEDLVQEVFLRTYRGIGSSRGDSAFQSWLYRITVNVVRTHLTRCRVRDAALRDSATDSERLEEIPDTPNYRQQDQSPFSWR